MLNNLLMLKLLIEEINGKCDKKLREGDVIQI